MNITAVIVAVLLASVITAVGGFWLLPMLRRLHFGQTILEIGPKWHQGKQGTPTMGGLMFIIGIPIAVVVAYLFMHASTVGDPMSAIMRARMFYGLVLALLFGAIGFLDDYLKVVKKQNEGLTEKQKMALQILFGAVYLLLLHISGTQSTMVTIPYIGTYDFGVFYYVFAMFAIIPFFVGIYCLIRLLVSISKREVFTSDNVARLRFFTYSFAALYGLMTLHDWLNHLEAVKQVALLGYEVVASHDTDFTSLVIIILFTEIFAAGVKIKEEQDLTI